MEFLFIITFALHKTEEVIVLLVWVARHRTALIKRLPKAVQSVLGISPKGLSRYTLRRLRT